MQSVKTLVVIGTNRGPYAAEDLVAAVHWSMQDPHFVVVVDTASSISTRTRHDYALLHSQGEGDIGFHRARGVQWAIEQGIRFQQLLLLDDECLLYGKHFDAWLAEQLRQPQMGLLGVADRYAYDEAFGRVAPLLAEWQVPIADDWGDMSRRTLHPGIIAMPYAVAQVLYEYGLLCPEGFERWPIGYGPFLSWTTIIHGFYQVAWGSQDRLLPPLYVGSKPADVAPHLLSTKFFLYRSARCVEGYTEEEIREVYKRFRGEPHKAVQPVRPSVTGKGVGEAI